MSNFLLDYFGVILDSTCQENMSPNVLNVVNQMQILFNPKILRPEIASSWSHQSKTFRQPSHVSKIR